MKAPLNSKSMIVLLMVSGLLDFAYSHEKHSTANPKPSSTSDDFKMAGRFQWISEEYRKTVKPIFQKSCFDCHSNQTRFPWYSSLPIAKQIVTQDISEAKKHLDFSKDFPFKGHGDPKEDLEAIRKSVRSDDMPPFRYRVLHPSSTVSEEEKRQVEDWIKKSIEILENKMEKP